jgi:hypothetical protein
MCEVEESTTAHFISRDWCGSVEEAYKGRVWTRIERVGLTLSPDITSGKGKRLWTVRYR